MLLIDHSGHDVLEGVGMNRDRSATEHAVIVYGGTSLHPAIDETDTLTLRIDNNAAASAQVTVTVYYALGY